MKLKKNTHTACNHLYMAFKKIKQLDELKKRKKKKGPSEKQMKKWNSEGTEPCSLSEEEFMNQGKNWSCEKYLFRIGYRMYVFNRVGLSFKSLNTRL